MRTYLIFLLSIWVITKANGQGRVPVVDDAFAHNLLTTVNRVYTILEQPKDHLRLLAESMDSVNSNGAPIYSATIVLPGSIYTGIVKVSNNLNNRTSKWEWFARLVDQPKKEIDLAAVKKLKQAIDTLLTSFTAKKQGVSIYTSGNVDDAWYKECVLDLRISFERPHNASPQQIKDSLLALYLPILKKKEFTREASFQFLGALEIEGFSNEEKEEIIMPVAKEVINHDFYAGYLFVLNKPYYIRNYNAALTVEQRERVTKTARQELDASYAKNGEQKKDPVVQQQQKQAAEKIPTDPCEKEIYYLKHKPGQYIAYNGTTAFVSAYSCPDNTYTICYLDKGKLVFKKNIAVASLANAHHSAASPFVICRNCQGKGNFMEYKWYYMNNYSGHYARSNEQHQVTCGVCLGSGYIKVR